MTDFTIQRFTFFNTMLLPVAMALRWFDKLLNRKQASFTDMPIAPVNAILTSLFGAEAALVPYVRLPFGLSLLVVVKAGAKAFSGGSP